MVSVDEIVSKCLEDIANVSKEKVVRHVLSCITERTAKSMNNVKRIVIDNGMKYQYMIYLEVYDKSTFGEVVELLKKAIDKVVEQLPQDLKNNFPRPSLVDWGEEKYLLFSKEYVAVKYVLE
ncbi:MAG: hypothetical protein GXO26_05560 [Crenarchaeota archaeon]|nr:hypothetical protein [Thermoproteota archaeon]